MISSYKFGFIALLLLVLSACYSYSGDSGDTGTDEECVQPAADPTITGMPATAGCYATIVGTYPDGATFITFVREIDDDGCGYE